jgi:hypothetical protein
MNFSVINGQSLSSLCSADRSFFNPDYPFSTRVIDGPFAKYLLSGRIDFALSAATVLSSANPKTHK